MDTVEVCSSSGRLLHVSGPRTWNRVVGAGRRVELIACWIVAAVGVYRIGQVVTSAGNLFVVYGGGGRQSLGHLTSFVGDKLQSTTGTTPLFTYDLCQLMLEVMMVYLCPYVCLWV